MSSRLGNERVTNYTISQAINLAEVKTLLEKMSNEEFKLQEIKNIIKEKISELTEHNLIKDIKKMSRKDLIKAINNIDKTK
jgi:DNA-binding transcriptional MerR regulator